MTPTDRAILDFEVAHPVQGEVKEQAIRDELDLSAVAYYYHLGRLLTTHEAEAYAPQLVHRLRRRAEQAKRARTVRWP